MARTIYLRIGQRDRVPLYDFIDSLKNFLGLLRHFDASVSDDERGSLVWEVVSLSQNSPPVVGVSPYPRRGKLDFSNAVESQVLESTNEITRSGERPTKMSDAALNRLERLALKTKALGAHSIFVNGIGPKRESVITERTLANVQEYTSAKYSNYGSLTGKLESISVHHGNEFRIWDEITGKPVRCKFTDEQEELVKALLRQRVVVSGEILANSTGSPISLKLEGLQSAPSRPLPTIKEMRGLVKDFTDGVSLKDYMEELSDG